MQPVYLPTISDQCKSIAVTNIRLEFLIRCREANITPKTLTRKTLTETIRSLRKKIEAETNLLTRNLIEESVFTDRQFTLDLINTIETNNKVELTNRQAKVNLRFHTLIQQKNTNHVFNTANYRYPVYNFTSHIIPPDTINFMKKFRPESSIYGFAANEVSIMAEIDSLAAEVQEMYKANETMILEEQKKFREIRKYTQSFIVLAEKSYKEPQHRYIRKSAKALNDFLKQNSLLAISPDKGKGWVLIQTEKIENRLKTTIDSNFKLFTKKRPANKKANRQAQPYTLTEFLDYREKRVARHVTDLKTKDGQHPESNFSISKNEARNARTQAASIAQPAPLAKIHKFSFLDEQIHGDGRPIDIHIQESSPEYASLIPISNHLKFRFVCPLKHSPSTPLGKLINTITKPIQNSGLRIESIHGVADAVQQNLRTNPITEDEEYVSFDVVSFYDRMDCSFVKKCLTKLWPLFNEKTDRNISLTSLQKALDVCWEDGILYKNEVYTPKFGAPTGHAVSSAAQNIVMTSFELEIIKPLISEGLISFYTRWVDDTLLRINKKDLETIQNRFKTFNSNLEFTVERAEKITENNKTINFIPFLDFSINWTDNDAYTKVYRKQTTSTVVMPFSEFGPEQWKLGTLIGFIRRAITHTSPTHMHLVDKELHFIEKQFLNVGYPAHIISQKINITLTKMLHPECIPPRIQKPENENRKWLPLFLPWSGKLAHNSVLSLKRSIPSDFANITFAYSVTKLRTLLPSFSTTPLTLDQNNEQRFLFSNIVYVSNAVLSTD